MTKLTVARVNLKTQQSRRLTIASERRYRATDASQFVSDAMPHLTPEQQRFFAPASPHEHVTYAMTVGGH